MSLSISADLTKLGISHKEYSKGYICQCPFAEWTHEKGSDINKSLVIWPEIDKFQCYACGCKGDYYSFLTTVNKYRKDSVSAALLLGWSADAHRLKLKLRRPVKQRFRREYFDDDLLQTFPSCVGTAGEKYLLSRGITCYEEFDTRFDRRTQRVIFPVRDKKGLLGAIGRGILRKEHYKYFINTSTIIGGEEKWQYDNLLLVEGFTDMLKIYPWAKDNRFDVGCTTTANISYRQVDILAKSGKMIYCMFDQDQAGEKGFSELERMYPSNLLYRIHWPFTSPNGNVKDPGDFSYSEFLESIL